MITAEQIPNTVFETHASLRTFAAEALTIEAARKEFEATRDTATFWQKMTEFGFDADEIEASIANPRARPAQLYM